MRKNPSSVSFREAAGGPERSEGGISQCPYFQSEIPRGVYPERNTEILRFAQNDKRRARNDRPESVTQPGTGPLLGRQDQSPGQARQGCGDSRRGRAASVG